MMESFFDPDNLLYFPYVVVVVVVVVAAIETRAEYKLDGGSFHV